jgi:hypothetical protein
MVRMNRLIGPFRRAKTCSTAERAADLLQRFNKLNCLVQEKT